MRTGPHKNSWSWTINNSKTSPRTKPSLLPNKHMVLLILETKPHFATSSSSHINTLIIILANHKTHQIIKRSLEYSKSPMIGLKRLIAIARKWQKMAGIATSSRTISLPRILSHRGLPHKGHFVVYSADNKRFVVPLTYLKRTVFRELLRMSEEEFGPPREGPIMLPCDAVSMEYIVSVVKKEVSIELERALLLSLTSRECSPTCAIPERLIMIGHCPNFAIHGFWLSFWIVIINIITQ